MNGIMENPDYRFKYLFPRRFYLYQLLNILENQLVTCSTASRETVVQRVLPEIVFQTVKSYFYS